uniref:Ig-like domain-containing protein n=1 Tax=Labrus bergylta TaxID=56723 RepID=A0A3Q3FDV0_9LABR
SLTAAGDKIYPAVDEVRGTEGESVTLRCNYETTDDDVYLYWYRHHSDLQAPQFILFERRNAPGISGDRFKATTNGTSVPLKIQKLQLTDSAVYYCALRPTVTGNTTTLYKNLWREDNTILHNIH